MDTRNGHIVPMEDVEQMEADQQRFFKEMMEEPTAEQMARVPPRVGRNERCPCGSGKKFKRCCLHAPYKARCSGR